MATYQLPDGRTVSTDMAFTLDEIQYPSNWLALSTPEDREERGIIGPLPEPAWYDQQFYWGYDDNGQLIPKDLSQLVTQYSEYVRMNANALLRETDWMVIREADNGTPIDPAIKDWRQAIRLGCEEKILYIGTVNTVDELAAYVTGAEYNVWPSLEPQLLVD
jgi:hypothetical protein